jgi:hypothetical protein
MGLTPEDMLSAVSASLAARTGRSLDEWVALVQAHDIDPLDRSAVRRWLRSEHGIAQTASGRSPTQQPAPRAGSHLRTAYEQNP